MLDPDFDHPWHIQWEFTYIRPGFEGRGDIDEIDKRDLQTVSPNQIQIKSKCVKAFAIKAATGVHVCMKLPYRVEKIIIIQDDYVLCYATENGKNVHSGEELKNNPFK